MKVCTFSCVFHSKWSKRRAGHHLELLSIRSEVRTYQQAFILNFLHVRDLDYLNLWFYEIRKLLRNEYISYVTAGNERGEIMELEKLCQVWVKDFKDHFRKEIFAWYSSSIVLVNFFGPRGRQWPTFWHLKNNLLDQKESMTVTIGICFRGSKSIAKPKRTTCVGANHSKVFARSF